MLPFLRLNSRRFASAASGADHPLRPLITKHLPSAMLRASDVIVERAEGSWVHDVSGRSYLDMTTGIGVTSTGHCHPRVVKAVQEQAALALHAQQQIVAHPQGLRLMSRLSDLLEPYGISKFAMSNSGAEAVELAVKLARHARPGRPNVIVMQGGYHGRTLLTGAMTTAKTAFSAGFQPHPAGIKVAPFPNCFSCPRATHSGDCCDVPEIKGIHQLMKQQSHPKETCAVVIEPVQGEGGYIPCPPGFLQAVRAFCDQHDLLLIVDEVQTGFGRTGKWFGFQHYDGVKPDILVMAKGIASGMPLSMIGTRPEIMDTAWPGSIGGTYGGNVVACAAANATLDVIEDEALIENAVARGEELVEQLRALQHEPELPIADVRGLGLMIGVEFAPHQVDAGFAKRVTDACLADGMLLLTCGSGECVRFIPPLTVSASEVKEAVGIFKGAVRKVTAGAA